MGRSTPGNIPWPDLNDPPHGPNQMQALAERVQALITLLQNQSPATSRKWRLLVYYGIPENVNGVFDQDYAAALFAGYDYLVIGEGLQRSAHEYHDSTAQVIEKIRNINPNIVIFGYINGAVSVGNESLSALQEKMDYWKAFEDHPSVGVDGIFMDLMGYDFEVPRTRFNALVDYSHSLDMPAMVNVYDADDVFGNTVEATYNPDGLPSSLASGDFHMVESHVVNSVAYVDRLGYNFMSEIRERAEESVNYGRPLGVETVSLNGIDYDAHTDVEIQNWFAACQAVAMMYSIPFGVNAYEYSSIAPNQNVVYPHHYDPAWQDFYRPDVDVHFNGTNELKREDINTMFHADHTTLSYSWRGPQAVYEDNANLREVVVDPAHTVRRTLLIPPSGNRVFIGSNPFDGGISPTTGDLFVYQDGHAQEGEIYEWDGDSWNFSAGITAPTASVQTVVYFPS